MTPNSTSIDPAWDSALRSLGLRPADDGATLRNGAISFRVRSGWGTFERPHRGDPLVGHLGRAGLWKPAAAGTRGRSVFELPPTILTRAASDARLSEEVADWALATAGGEADAVWSPPPREQVEGWMPPGALTLQAGAIARQGTLLHDDHRLALVFPIASGIPSDLSAARMAWLRELLSDGQNRWRLARIGLTDDGEARAEADLSGAPPEAIEELLPVSLDALRLVVSSLAEPADFLVNGAENCRALEVGPTGRSPRRKRRKPCPHLRERSISQPSM